MKYCLTLMLALMMTACSLDFGSDDDDDNSPESFMPSLTLTIQLSGSQEVPSVMSTDTATVEFQFDQNLMQFRATLDATDVEGFSAAHIHQGYVGSNGDVAFTFEPSSTAGMYYINETNLNQAAVDEFMDGGWYVNVHTEDNASGELRGQILTSDFTLFTFNLSGEQEVPTVDTEAMGYGYATYNSSTNILDLKVKTMEADDTNAAHIHTGRIGTNGDVAITLIQGLDSSEWMTEENTVIDSTTAQILMDGGHYVNLHTTENPSGEIRGQIIGDNMALINFALGGDQEVPAVTTDATGNGYALVNMDNYALELKVVTNNLMDATAAHIHTGRVGMNGEVLVALEQSSEDMGVWMTPENTMLTEEIYQVLASGGHYVNIHTPVNTGGEIRGQIVTDNYALMTFPIEGQQQVPLVTTDAMGYGYALFNTQTNELELTAVTMNLVEASAAHIHSGSAGSNGDVVVTLMQDTANTNVWKTDGSVVLDESVAAQLLDAGHYVNIHTTLNANGEIRGQIVP
ncbi:CHRD domain-containing protein [Catenovulum sp. 2E275]|uniref:CHRD domain-containing protein n=1 Tax=Catenovulum sp. 2E275 TaxID=2980497 RepID=UPI0021D12820|nr:CHRD domain-containing protein [Catenovulum sp. 2E275]MCU4674110.1 CHRD domain-containing protein [Catenovulum sp. 2E275]